ncbi:L-threonylcarbamoyladenylate synthase [Streptomyces sp. NPDC002122]|uniref:L-threonylcarbamoyladenylate synthase n=1 Tax=Streptomyces sp. NPDC002122 TaxID=3154407 RepID=UPI00332C71E5
MTQYFDCTEPTARATGLRAAVTAVRQGRLVVLPTDTVYGLGAGAFDPRAVAALLTAKGRGRHKPSPVLVDSADALGELVDELPRGARELIEAFWPGALTLIVRHRPSLGWDLGETKGTVAVRMPDHALARSLIAATGPLAVSSANITDHPSPQDCAAAREMLGDAVSVYLDCGQTAGVVSSSIVDLSGPAPALVREGVVTAAQLRPLLPDLVVP